MQLERELAARPGIEAAGVVMGTAANRPLLAANGLLTAEAEAAAADDLVVVVRAASDETAAAALAAVDDLLARRAAAAEGDYRPRSLAAAARLLPDAGWVLISVPGRWAAGVAREALALPPHGRHVFLYSDNVPLAEEVALKREARERGLLVMGPDCGTAIVAGAGLGFANRVRRGAIGLVGASGTGLQAIASRVHALGGGISHALGTGGRDLSAEVGGATALQALDLLARDPETRVIVLVSKPPAPAVAAAVLAAARATGKPVVVDFLGYPPPGRRLGNLHFAVSLGEAAELAVALAVELAGEPKTARSEPGPAVETDSGRHQRPSGAGSGAGESAAGEPGLGARKFLRALFAGGTLASEAVLGLRPFLSPLAANLSFPGVTPLADPATSVGHTVVDLGADELTVGRPHPMIDPRAAAERLRREAADPEVAAILFDVVLGDGAHSDPAAELAPAVAAARDGGGPAVAAVIVGTDEDPQDLAAQRERLEAAGARVFTELPAAIAWAVESIGSRPHPLAVDRSQPLSPATPTESGVPVPLTALAGPLAAINVGLASFAEALAAQGVRAIQVDWRPPAGGDERLAALLAKMKGGR